jgi:hypothetical protein
MSQRRKSSEKEIDKAAIDIYRSKKATKGRVVCFSYKLYGNKKGTKR